MSEQNIIGLGLESSCDETAAAVIMNGKVILSNVIFTQIDLHRDYYGVVPEIASRAHLEVINPVIEQALKEADVTFEDLDYVAATNRPGLIGSLLIALQSAKAISYTMQIPLIGVNHLEGHLYAPFLEGNEIEYPYIGLLVSGGNTAVYHVRGVGDMELLGSTVDDAAGEAFDKVAKYLDLGYPGGPVIEKLARNAKKKDILLPKILPNPEDRRFSYSGLKTAVVNYIRNNPDTDKAELVYSFQERAVELLVRRVFTMARDLGIRTIVVAGGVASNGRLRELLGQQKMENEKILVPSPLLCTDNAAMIAGIAYHYYERSEFNDLSLDVSARVDARERGCFGA